MIYYIAFLMFLYVYLLIDCTQITVIDPPTVYTNISPYPDIEMC